MPTKKILTPLLSEKYYHIFNRGNDGEKIFFSCENYRYFMMKYHELLGGYVDTYAYCLIPNHFHFLVKVKESNEQLYHLKVSHQFRRFFQSYALAINKQEGRDGSLFRKYFRRIQVADMEYLKRMVFYIHFNPQKHQLVQDFRSYPYSSYGAYADRKIDTFLNMESTVKWFNDDEDFFNYHDVMHDEKIIKKYRLEDD